MDSQAECGFIDARLDPSRCIVEHQEQRARACRGQSETAAQAEEIEQARCWAAEQAILADAEYAERHGLELP